MEYEKIYSNCSERVDNLSDKYKDLLDVIPDTFPYRQERLNTLSNHYGTLLKAFTKFQEKVKNQIKSRE